MISSTWGLGQAIDGLGVRLRFNHPVLPCTRRTSIEELASVKVLLCCIGFFPSWRRQEKALHLKAGTTALSIVKRVRYMNSSKRPLNVVCRYLFNASDSAYVMLSDICLRRWLIRADAPESINGMVPSSHLQAVTVTLPRLDGGRSRIFPELCTAVMRAVSTRLCTIVSSRLPNRRLARGVVFCSRMLRCILPSMQTDTQAKRYVGTPTLLRTSRYADVASTGGASRRRSS